MTDANSVPAPPGAGQTVGILVIVGVLLGGYFQLAALMGIVSTFAGILFMVYWGAFKFLAPKEFLPTLLGALGGVAISWAIYLLAVRFGTPGVVAGLLLLNVAIYVQIRDLLPIAVNLPFMLFMIVGTIPQVAKDAAFVDMALAVLLAAAYFGGLLFLFSRLKRARRTASAAA